MTILDYQCFNINCLGIWIFVFKSFEKLSIFKSSILFLKKSKYSRKKPTLKLMKSQNSLYFIQSRTINENIIYEQDIR